MASKYGIPVEIMQYWNSESTMMVVEAFCEVAGYDSVTGKPYQTFRERQEMSLGDFGAQPPVRLLETRLEVLGLLAEKLRVYLERARKRVS
jgi:hypothetical protein